MSCCDVLCCEVVFALPDYPKTKPNWQTSKNSSFFFSSNPNQKKLKNILKIE